MIDSNYDYDLFVIGAGSGGVRAARMSAQYGAKVAIAEQQYLGGTCVNVGCVPKKLFVYASEFSEEFHAAKGFGWDIEQQPKHQWQRLIANKNAEIGRLNGIYGNLLDGSGVTLYESKATITGPNEVSVDGQKVTAERILIATGGYPFVPDIPGKELAITSNEAFYLEDLPEKIILVGGGYIAVEFAGIFNGLGVETHLIYRGAMFLRGFDNDIREALAVEMKNKGVHLHFNTNIEALKSTERGQIEATLTDGSTLTVGQAMYATGRKANLKGLGLENTAVEVRNNGSIIVNNDFQTAEPGVYAIGDVIDRVALTPVAITEAMSLSAALYKNEHNPVDYSNIPTAVFSQPNIGTVGLSEEQAREQYGDVRIYKSQFRAMKQTLGGGNDKVLMKLIVDNTSDKVIGCHMLGDHAGEIIQGIGIAIKAGATKADFDNTVGIHPTAAEEFVTMREPVS
ncbi:glutathione-disulfide reductase [Porticoccus sp. W117]|uniref:glutathione-disulfide reductase n=1 Tax=Porticoccus sp. W117 TaxID=3054777 RepID=UPI00259A3C77|nr:glutathione-disulfide reductase [Porticoccus sp. W117]MDM3871954.1 glutathione-disulfide reductase [Porticoccus sp. W117]